MGDDEPHSENGQHKVLKAGNIVGGFFPLKSKKSFYCVLKENAIELHESEKHEKKGKMPKHLIDLTILFNVHQQEEEKLKDCVAVMGPEETFFFRGEKDVTADEWYAAVMEAAIPARALKLGRPVLHDEFFECAWDVAMVTYPKLKKVTNGERMEDLVAKHEFLTGNRRLCFYPHAIIIAQKGITPVGCDPTSATFPPFKEEHFVEFPMVVVANFGRQEKYFFLRVGRSATTGSGEMWAMADSGFAASIIHKKLDEICRRESEKKRQMGTMARLPSTISSHRDRVGSSHHRERQSSGNSLHRQRTASLDQAAHNLSSRYTMGPERKTSAFTIPSPSAPQAVWTSQHLPVRCNTITSSGRQSISSLKRGGNETIAEEPYPLEGSGTREDSGSGGTIKAMDRTRNSRPSDDYDTMNAASTSTHTPIQSQTRIMLRPNSNSGINDENAQNSYTRMDLSQRENSPQAMVNPEMNFLLDEVRSYVSDSSDSCMSHHGNTFAQQDGKRAYSFGSRPPPNNNNTPFLISHGPQDPNDTIEDKYVLQDPRKRAFSLGSKTWFRKFTSNNRQNEISRSGELDDFQDRSSSFGSTGRSASFVRQRDVRSLGGRSNTNTSIASAVSHLVDNRADLMELDFGRVQLGRSGSGSVASVESPTRSRANSFGNHSGMFARTPADDVQSLTSPGDKPSSKLIADMLRTGQADKRYQYKNTEDYYMMHGVGEDYVMSDFNGGANDGPETPGACVSTENPLKSAGSVSLSSRNSQSKFETIPEHHQDLLSRSSSSSSDYTSGRNKKDHLDRKTSKNSITVEAEINYAILDMKPTRKITTANEVKAATECDYAHLHPSQSYPIFTTQQQR